VKNARQAVGNGLDRSVDERAKFWRNGAVPTPSSNFILRHLQDDLNLVGQSGQDRSLLKFFAGFLVYFKGFLWRLGASLLTFDI